MKNKLWLVALILSVGLFMLPGALHARGVLGEEAPEGYEDRAKALEDSGLFGEIYDDELGFYDEVEEPVWEEQPAQDDEEYEYDFGDDILTDDEPDISAESAEDGNFEPEAQLTTPEGALNNYDNDNEELDDEGYTLEDGLPYLNQDSPDSNKEYPMTEEKNNNLQAEVVLFKTSKGEMIAEFWPDVAPNTVANFKDLARKGFYDGTCFHRIVKGFMIQGGDPLTVREDKKPLWGTGGPGYTIDAEFNDRKHVKGVLSMARASDPNSAGSQFFICLDDAPFLDGQYTAFGKLLGGEDVLEAIGNTPTEYGAGGEKSQPLERIEVESVKILSPSQLTKPEEVSQEK